MIGKIMGQSSDQMMKESFSNAINRKYDLVILGSSRTHAAIDPDYLKIPSYNFSFSGDSYNQCYYKLKFLKSNNKEFKYAIIGVEYFHFAWFLDERNNLYLPYFDKQYFLDYFPSPLKHPIAFKNYLNDYFNRYMSIYFTNTLMPFYEGTVKTIKEEQGINDMYIKANGQYISNSIANPLDSIKYDYKTNPILVDYFEKSATFCKQNNIKLFWLMTPGLANTLSFYPKDVVERYNLLIKSTTDNQNIYFLNYSNDSRFSISDFKDVSHLNIEGAKKFTKIVQSDINKLILKN